MHRPEREFKNVRVRYQRLSDNKFFTGWVEYIANPELSIKSGTETAVQPGDRFAFELFGPKANLKFVGELTNINTIDALKHWDFQQVEGTSARIMQVNDATYDFHITSEFTFTEPKEDCRKAVRSMIATVIHNGNETDVSVTDLSPTGMGIIIGERLRQGEALTVRVVTMLKTIELEGVVRYSRKDPTSAELFKIGIRFEKLDRVNLAAWEHMVQAA